MAASDIARLALADGTILTGHSFGAPGTAQGEVVFNTSMTGYQEILTDPSYHGQIVTMTYPLMGNYGICAEDVESSRVQVAGFVVRELARRHSNFRAQTSLQDYLAQNDIVGICNVDTRALTRKLRIDGAMPGILTTESLSDAELAARARRAPGVVGRDLVRRVSADGSSHWTAGYESAFAGPARTLDSHSVPRRPRVVAFDCGMKYNICRNLVEAGFDLTVVPARAPFEQVMEHAPDGIFVSNGPGDPEPVDYTIDTVRRLIAREIPMFGICLGIELIGLALGGRTFKLKFGHRGANHPVKNLDTGRVEITAQNHGFAVDIDSLPAADVRVTHSNLNDRTLEGIAHRRLPLFAVQYHPEASPGPHDATYLFDAFYDMVRTPRPLEHLGS